jgi:hypothetical protein
MKMRRLDEAIKMLEQLRTNFPKICRQPPTEPGAPPRALTRLVEGEEPTRHLETPHGRLSHQVKRTDGGGAMLQIGWRPKHEEDGEGETEE